MHLIQEHIVDVNCESEAMGNLLKNEIAQVLKTALYPKLDVLMQKYDKPNVIITIDYLRVSIPNTNSKNWKTKLVEESLLQIETYLQANINTTNTNNQRNKLADEIQQIDFQHYLQQLFLDFLLTGTLKSNTISEELATIYNQLVIDVAFAEKLRIELSKNNLAILRWSVNIPETIKQQLVSLFAKEISLKTIQKTTQEIRHKLLYNKTKSIDLNMLESFLHYIHWVAFFKRKSTLKESEKETVIKNGFTYFGFNVIRVKNILNQLNSTSKKETYLSRFTEQFSSNNTSKKILSEDSIKSKQDENRIAQDDDLNTMITKVLEDYNNPQKEKTDIQYWYLKNAGLIIVHPFLLTLFKNIGYLKKDHTFKNTQAQHRAVLLLQYLITGKEIVFENDLILNKILCGVPIHQSVFTEWEITSEEKKQCQSLLLSIIEHWSVLKNTSVATLQESFLRRDGKLAIKENRNFELLVEQKSIDILLDQLPWGIGTIKTSWMENYMTTHWT